MGFAQRAGERRTFPRYLARAGFFRVSEYARPPIPAAAVVDRRGADLELADIVPRRETT
jgi:hypothetical protein